MSDNTKVCPFCAEDIKAAAIVCKHCGRELPGYEDSITQIQDAPKIEVEKTDREKTRIFSINRIFDFSGRANRGEFALYCFVPITAIVILAVIFGNTLIQVNWEFLIPIFSLIYAIAVLGVSIRRFHDLGHSGWAALLLFVPLLNVIVILYLLFSPGKEQGLKENSSRSWIIGVLIIIVISFTLIFVYELPFDSGFLTEVFRKPIISEPRTPTPKKVVTRTPMTFFTPTPDMPLWAPPGAIYYADAGNYIGNQVLVCGQIHAFYGLEDEPGIQNITLIFGDLGPSSIMAIITKRNFGFSSEMWQSFYLKHVCVFGVPEIEKLEDPPLWGRKNRYRIIIPVDNPANLIFDQN